MLSTNEITSKEVLLLPNFFHHYRLFFHIQVINIICLIILQKGSTSGAEPGFLKRGGALCRPPWLAGEKNFRFQMV